MFLTCGECLRGTSIVKVHLFSSVRPQLQWSGWREHYFRGPQKCFQRDASRGLEVSTGGTSWPLWLLSWGMLYEMFRSGCLYDLKSSPSDNDNIKHALVVCHIYCGPRFYKFLSLYFDFDIECCMHDRVKNTSNEIIGVVRST